VLVAVLTGVRFSVDSSRMDLLLCAGFSVAAISIFAFEIAPTLGGSAIGKPETWASLIARIISAVLITGAAFARGQVRKPDRGAADDTRRLFARATRYLERAHARSSRRWATPGARTDPSYR